MGNDPKTTSRSIIACLHISGTFLKIKHSWQGMPDNKQQTICQMLTSKVERMVAKPLLIEDTKAVPNEWNDTLDDLQDDPDFPKVCKA
jgi:hypothetical protein